jgi:hypothetical protein
MKKPDLLILIAIWEFISAFVALIGIAAISVFAFPAVMGMRFNWNGRYYNGMMSMNNNIPRVGAIFGLSVGIMVLACFLAVAILAGIGLLAGKEWGRISGIVHSVLTAFWVPIGTVIGVLCIVYLTRQEVKDYFIPLSKL